MPKLKARAPAMAWKKGFFSMGSQNTALTYPVGANSVPPRLKRTLQTPAKPDGVGQRWPQAKHSTRLRSRGRHNSAGVVWRASCAASVAIAEFRHSLYRLPGARSQCTKSYGLKCQMS